MARLLTFPHQPGVVAITPVSGPAARSSGANTASDGSEQVFSGIGDLVAMQLDFNRKQGMNARRERGLFAAFHSGANAGRLSFFDPDLMKPSEAGIVGDFGSQQWANGKNWSNGEPWAPSYPVVPIAAAAAKDSGVVSLSPSFWGHGLGLGDYFGFFPFHFGLYMVTEVVEAGKYRIWPRLRKALTTDEFATLHPVLVMRPTGPGAISQSRGLVTTETTSITLVEVIDPYVRSAFTG